MKTLQKGFTLIELMIVVAIVGILAAIALPAYQEYIARSKLSEALSLLAGGKTSATEFVASNGIIPDTAQSAGINETPSSSKYVSAMAFTSDTSSSRMFISATLRSINSVLDGAKLGMRGDVNLSTGEVAWTCVTSLASTNHKFLPSNCRTQETTLP